VLYGLYALVMVHFAKEEIYLPLLDARLHEPLDMLKAKRLPSINAKVTYLRWLFRPDQSSR
jgi:hypothetical protein